eukprot:5143559-Pleurochrysis_carterae.AAC.3
MLGQLAPLGTGEFELYLNTEMLQQAQTPRPRPAPPLHRMPSKRCFQLLYVSLCVNHSALPRFASTLCLAHT